MIRQHRGLAAFNFRSVKIVHFDSPLLIATATDKSSGEIPVRNQPLTDVAKADKINEII